MAFFVTAALCSCALPARAAGPRLEAEADARAAYAEARGALAVGQWDHAEILLERVLMLMPDHAEARIDFAALMARRGQVDLARELLTGLAQDTRTSGAHRQRLREMLAGLANGPASAGGPLVTGQTLAAVSAPRAQAAAQHRWRLEGQVGASSNPLARTSADGITLSLADGPVTLPLGNRPQSGAVAGAALQYQSPSGGSAHLRWTGADVTVQRLAFAGNEEAYRAAVWGEGPQLGTNGLQGGWLLSTQQGFDGQRRHLAAASATAKHHRYTLAVYQDPDLPDHGVWLRADRLLPSAGAWPLAGLTAQGGVEIGRSLLKNQGYTRVSVSLDYKFESTRRLQIQASYQEDLRGYSPLLENNARRRLSGLNVVLEQQLEPCTRLPLVARVFHASRHSNLTLFKFRDAGFQLVAVRVW